MRSTHEQLREIMKRAEYIREKKSSQRTAVSFALAACACAVLLFATFLYLPALSETEAAPAGGQYGSLLLNASYMGYVVVGVLAFLLGVCATMLCLHLRRLRKKERERS